MHDGFGLAFRIIQVNMVVFLYMKCVCLYTMWKVRLFNLIMNYFTLELSKQTYLFTVLKRTLYVVYKLKFTK